jgi:outer membrane protein, multidrug efflux system
METRMPRYVSIAALGILAGIMQGCITVGPDFVAPQDLSAPRYRHTGQSGFAPESLPLQWWTLFGDDALDQIEQRALQDNPGLKASAFRLLQARALLDQAKAQELPSLNLGSSAERLRTSATTPQAVALGGLSVLGNQFEARGSMLYEFDIWGKVRRIVEAAGAREVAAGSDYDGVLLLLTTQVAGIYWQLRGSKLELAILEQALETRRETRRLVETRFTKGLSNELDVARSEIELENAKADLRDVERSRNALEHSLAVLVGVSPSQPWPMRRTDRLPRPPRVPVGLPASLLAQRPDLASSVAVLRAANAEIGVAEAAYYPSLQLTGNFGYASGSLRVLTDARSRQFEIGPLAVSLPAFDGGRARAGAALARERYDEALANHQDKLLNALREVEDALSDSELLELQYRDQARARRAAERAYQIALARYERGLSNYLDVTDAQRASLAAGRAAAKIHTQRLLASVAIIRALGGSWGPRSAAPDMQGQPQSTASLMEGSR